MTDTHISAQAAILFHGLTVLCISAALLLLFCGILGIDSLPEQNPQPELPEGIIYYDPTISHEDPTAKIVQVMWIAALSLQVGYLVISAGMFALSCISRTPYPRHWSEYSITGCTICAVFVSSALLKHLSAVYADITPEAADLLASAQTLSTAACIIIALSLVAIVCRDIIDNYLITGQEDGNRNNS